MRSRPAQVCLIIQQVMRPNPMSMARTLIGVLLSHPQAGTWSFPRCLPSNGLNLELAAFDGNDAQDGPVLVRNEGSPVVLAGEREIRIE